MAVPTVLIVDHDADIRAILTTILWHAGYRVVAHEDGGQALEVARNERPALVLTSYPVAVGETTLTEAIRQDPATRDIPVLNVTTRVMPVDLEAAERAGVSENVALPIALNDLVAKVREALAAPALDRVEKPL